MKSIMATVAALALVGCAESSEPPDAPPEIPIEAAYDACFPPRQTVGVPSGITVGDRGRSLSVDGDADIEDVGCLLLALGTPDAVITRMDHTRALDGAQEAAWGDLSAWWTYHPDQGLNLVIEQR